MPCDYTPPIKSIGHGITCTADLVSESEVRGVFLELSQDIGLKLRKQGLAANGVRITVRDNTLSHRQYQCKLPFPTQSYLEIYDAGIDLFHRRYSWSNNIRSLTISAIDLISADTPVQLDLWTDMSKHKRRIRLEETIEDIRRRFGLHAINFATAGSMKIPVQSDIEYKMPSVMYQ